MATKENRIALKGGLDFVNRRFKGVTVALIDAQGIRYLRTNVDNDHHTKGETE